MDLLYIAFMAIMPFSICYLFTYLYIATRDNTYSTGVLRDSASDRKHLGKYHQKKSIHVTTALVSLGMLALVGTGYWIFTASNTLTAVLRPVLSIATILVVVSAVFNADGAFGDSLERWTKSIR